MKKFTPMFMQTQLKSFSKLKKTKICRSKIDQERLSALAVSSIAFKGSVTLNTGNFDFEWTTIYIFMIKNFTDKILFFYIKSVFLRYHRVLQNVS